MAVKITGPILAALLFEHANADEDKEGLLLGTVTTEVTKKISDSDISQVESQTVYNIYSFLPFFGVPKWRNNKGMIKEDVLSCLLQGYDTKEVLGWYKLRRNSTLAPSMRENAICKCMRTWLKQVNGNEASIFMLCTSQTPETVYICDHLFMAYDDRNTLVSLPETVISLSGTAQPNYRCGALCVSSPTCAYNRLLNESRSSLIDKRGGYLPAVEIIKVTEKMHNKLEKLCKTVGDSEMMVAKELAELRVLRRKVAVCKEESNRLAQTESNSSLSQTDDEDSDGQEPTASADAPLDSASHCSSENYDCGGLPESGDVLLSDVAEEQPSIMDVNDCIVEAPCLVPAANSSSVPAAASEKTTNDRNSTDGMMAAAADSDPFGFVNTYMKTINKPLKADAKGAHAANASHNQSGSLPVSAGNFTPDNDGDMFF